MDQVLDFVRQIYKGKTVGRFLFNQEVRERTKLIQSPCVDLAGGADASYYNYLPSSLAVTKTNYYAGKCIDKVVDINGTLPFDDSSQHSILFFNALYIVEDRVQTLSEMRRILSPGGTLLLASPFVANEMPEPHDYCRLTREGLEKEFRDAGFTNITITRYGERFTAAANILHPFYYFNTVRLVAYSVALLLDRLIPLSLTNRHPMPLGYFCILKK